MTIYSGPVFEMARQQFQVIADHLEIPADERDRLLYPKRAVVVSCPIHRDNGNTCGVPGLPGPAPSDAWPDKRRHPLLTQRRYWRGGGAGDLDELEMRIGRSSLWRCEGRRHG